MYTVVNRIPVPASDPGAFEERFAQAMGASLPGVDGLVGARLLRPTKEGGEYLAVMEFTSGEAFTAWLRSPSFAAAHGAASHGMASVVESYETVADVRGAGRGA